MTYHLLYFSPRPPPTKTVITGVALCHKTFGGPRSKRYALFISYTEEKIQKVVKEL